MRSNTGATQVLVGSCWVMLGHSVTTSTCAVCWCRDITVRLSTDIIRNLTFVHHLPSVGSGRPHSSCLPRTLKYQAWSQLGRSGRSVILTRISFLREVELYSTLGVWRERSPTMELARDIWLLFSSSLYPYETGPDDLKQTIFNKLGGRRLAWWCTSISGLEGEEGVLLCLQTKRLKTFNKSCYYLLMPR